MLLTFPNGDEFATGATIYKYSPLPGSGSSARIVLQVLVEGQPTSAILDTGAPYLICSPSLSSHIGFDPDTALSQHEILIRGYNVRGDLQRINLTFTASKGTSLSLEVIAFVPSPDEHFNFPSFLGFLGCLDWIRFAVDPSSGMFYFGAHP
jgi:hypothetical protein